MDMDSRADHSKEIAPTPASIIAMDMNFVARVALSRGSPRRGRSRVLTRALKTKMNSGLVDITVTASDTGPRRMPHNVSRTAMGAMIPSFRTRTLRPTRSDII